MEPTKTADADQRHQLVLLRSHVERCLQDVWEVNELGVDSDGDYPFRQGTAMCWVSPFGGPVPGVRVFAHAAHGVKPSGRLLREVNELNGRSTWARVVVANGVVRVTSELHWAGVDRLALEQAIRAVGTVADDIGALMAAVYGGDTPFPVEQPQDEPYEGRPA